MRGTEESRRRKPGAARSTRAPPANQKKQVMKTRIILRGIMQYALFAVGFTAFAFAFGEVEAGTPEAEWYTAFTIYYGIGAACFYALYRMLRNH